jgi:hypothetical protein
MVKMECSSSGNPQPSVFWTKEGSQELMFPDNIYGRIHVTAEGTLEIQNVQKNDAGFYVCSAFSVAGSGTTRALLQVSFKLFLILLSRVHRKVVYFNAIKFLKNFQDIFFFIHS